jgi:LytS/YehU family sensor histidine kinase
MTAQSTIPPIRRPSPRRLAIAGATLMMLLWTLFVRASSTDATFSLEGLRDIGYFPYYAGLATLEYAIIFVPLLVLARTAWFKNLLTQRWQSQDYRRLFFVFIGLQMIFVLYRLNIVRIEQDWVEYGLLVPLLAGLIGGWRIGLGIGIFAALTNGGLDYLNDYLDWIERFSLTDYIEYYVLKSTLAITPIWVGIVAGWWGEQREKLQLPAVLTLGLALYLGSFSFLFISYNEYSEFVTDRLIPNLLLMPLTLAAFVTLMRFVQEESLRRDAEAQRLTLSETELTLANTQLALAQAELRALHAQINPHFLFNALNTIRYFIRTDPDKARTLLTRLSQIFQRVLHAGETIPLRDEIETVEAYLELEAARLEERLNIIWTNLAGDSADLLVPSLILQPIVENAVVHGIAPKPEGGTIHILLDRIANDLLLQVSDDGVGFDTSSQSAGDSIALNNITRRLLMRYGNGYTPVVQSTVGNGTRVTLRIPIEP